MIFAFLNENKFFSYFMREILNLYDNKSNFRFSKNAYINKMKFIIY
jgi:hypothetical protein